MSDKLWAAMQLADHPDVCEALAQGLSVPRHRLRQDALARIGETTHGEFVLTEELVLRCEVALNGEQQRPSLRVVTESAPLIGSRWTTRSLDGVTARQVRWLVPGLIPLRALTLLAGVGGFGKSTWLAARTADLSREGLDVIIVSPEDAAEEILVPRLAAAKAALERVHETVLAEGGIETFQLPRDLDNLRLLVHDKRARLVILDPVVAAIETSFDAHKDQHVRSVLAGLNALAEEEDAAVAMVGHLNKAPSTDAYIRVANSVAFWNASRSVVLITEDGASGEDGLRLVAQRKANWSRLAPVERHRLEEIVLPDRLDPETGEPIVTSRMVFVEVADDVDRADVLTTGPRTKTETVETLLEALLADGDWHEAAGIKKLLAAAGFKERTAQRAANELDVKYESRGFPASTWWRLPVAPDAVAPTSSPTFGATGKAAQPSRLKALGAPVAPTREGLAQLSEEQRTLDELTETFDTRPVDEEGRGS